MIFFVWHQKKSYISAVWVGTEKTDTFPERSIVADWYSLLLIPKMSFLDLLRNYLLPTMKSPSSIWRQDLPVSKEQDIWIVKQLAKIRLVSPLILNPSTTFSSPLPWFKSAAKSLPLLKSDSGRCCCNCSGGIDLRRCGKFAQALSCLWDQFGDHFEGFLMSL